MGCMGLVTLVMMQEEGSQFYNFALKPLNSDPCENLTKITTVGNGSNVNYAKLGGPTRQFNLNVLFLLVQLYYPPPLTPLSLNR